MKRFILPLLMIVLNLTMGSCNNGDKVTIQEGLQAFHLKTNNKDFQGVIVPDMGMVSVGGIEFLSSISGVNYTLAKGATISPDPSDFVGKWKQDMKFNVTDASGLVREYVVHLNDVGDSGGSASGKKVVIGYLPGSDWAYGSRFKNLRWEYLTHVNISFLYVNSDGDLADGSVSKNIAEIRDVAHSKGVKVLIALQSDGKNGFVAAIKDPAIRTRLVNNTIKYARDNGMDGIDIDFEVYESVGPNLVAFMKELYEKKGDLLVTSAVATWNAGQGYSTDWHKYSDYINLMAYDFTGGWSKEGQHSSYESSIGLVNLWLNTLQAPASKLVLGLPFYGYTWDKIPGADDVKAIRYHQIMSAYPGQFVSQKDQVGRTYYNGKPTLERKSKYVKDNGLAGVMIWQIFQDAEEDEESLLKHVGEIVLNEE